MSLEFEDQSNIMTRRNQYAPQFGFITNFLFRHHIVKTEKRANQLMIVMSLVILICAITLGVINVVKLNSAPKVTYIFTQEVLNSLPQNIQAEIISQ